ncbi:nucleoporin Nup43 [Macrobrachium rosenbergii]|uniref:nucleoporin Nup43 n=1 Tax=Macrobrachium rosenbergii TaxID=79674 RepID=UPI0034D60A0E
MARPQGLSKKYVSRKIKTVRWKPPVSEFGRTDTFVTGSWDDAENILGVWHVPEIDDDPSFVYQLHHPDSVNDIQYITRDTFASGGSSGNVRLYQHTSAGQLEEKFVWEKIHKFIGGTCPCTALASNGDQIASVGEEGKLVILNPSQERISRTIESVGGCSIYAVIYVRASEVLTANMQGHLKLWDLRADQPSKATLISPDQIAVCNLAAHPNQQHIVASGGEDGALTLWDMRNINQPITVIAAHSGSITSVKFHPASPEHLFTCGTDGQILHWDASANDRPSSMPFKNSREPSGSSISVWLTSDVAQGIIDTTSIIPPSPLPINSVDVEGSVLIAGSDNEAVFTIRNVFL